MWAPAYWAPAYWAPAFWGGIDEGGEPPLPPEPGGAALDREEELSPSTLIPATVGADLDWCQEFLRDAPQIGVDGELWSRQELLDYYLDAYRELLTTANPRRWTGLSVPPQFTITGTQPWEAAHSQGGTFWQWTFQGPTGGIATSSPWELEQVEGYTPSQGSEGITQGWERQFVNPTYTPFRFGLRRDSSNIVRMWYNRRILLPLTVRELDSTYRQWTSLGNYPVAWTTGTGDDRTFEVYEVQTTPTDDYEYRWDVASYYWRGMVRYMTGSRTYTVVHDPHASQAVGIVRRMSSPDRQYWPVILRNDQIPTGIVTVLHSDEDALLVLEQINADEVTFDETDIPGLLPAPMRKYCRYHVLARAFGRQGEGRQLDLAAFFAFWFETGKRILPQLARLARKDVQYARGPVVTRTRPPRPHLPSGYPYVGRF